MNTPHLTGIDAKLGKEKSVQRMFSSIASTYDINNTILSLGIHHYWKKKAVALLGVKNNDSILDLCTGTGDLAILLTDRLNGSGMVTAADLNLDMMIVGKNKEKAARGNLKFVRCNAELTGFKDNSFDGVTVAFGIRNLSDIPQGFKEIHRILKKGGKMVCLEFSTPASPVLKGIYNLFSNLFMPLGSMVSGDKTRVYDYLPESIRAFPAQEMLKEIIADAGFETVEYQNITGGIVALHSGVKSGVK